MCLVEPRVDGTPLGSERSVTSNRQSEALPSVILLLLVLLLHPEYLGREFYHGHCQVGEAREVSGRPHTGRPRRSRKLYSALVPIFVCTQFKLCWAYTFTPPLDSGLQCKSHADLGEGPRRPRPPFYFL